MSKSPGTNWIRIDSGEKSHLIVFASHDWKVLGRESGIPMGRHWLKSFGFGGPSLPVVTRGPLIGYEVIGDRETMLNDSRLLLSEVVAFANDPTPSSYFHGSVRPRKPPRKRPIAWPHVLPPLIDFLSSLDKPKVKIYNHHQ
jgi:hypothetical protein